MPSSEFSPLHWHCPHCLESYSENNNQLTFLRGTCHHDVCSKCITKSINRRNLMKRGASTRKVAANISSLIVEVSCPIDKCYRGKFLVDRTTFGSSEQQLRKNNNEVIDLYDDESDSNDGEHVAGVVKKEVKEEPPLPALPDSGGSVEEVHPHGAVFSSPVAVAKPDNITIVSRDPKPKKNTSSNPTSAHSNKQESNTNIISPPPVKECHSNRLTKLKPLFDIDDEVVAAWWNPKLDIVRQGTKAKWYPGRIKSYKDIGHTEHGPTRRYHIQYDDGDELENLQDFWIFPKKDYQLTMRLEEMGWKPIGVRRTFDKSSSDRYMRDVGWYEVTVDGEDQKFSRLTEAMKAHDECVIREHGKETKKSYLNMAEDYPWLFAETETTAAESKGVAGTTGMNNSPSPKENGMSGLAIRKKLDAVSGFGIKTEHVDDSGNAKRNGGDESDEESRFSGVDESKSDEEAARVDKTERVNDSGSAKRNGEDESDEESRSPEVDESKSDEEDARVDKMERVNDSGNAKRYGEDESDEESRSPEVDESKSDEENAGVDTTEHVDDSGNAKRNGEDESDEESRSPEVGESKSNEENARVEWREVKRRRLDLSPEANVENTEFWSVNKNHIEFTYQAFMTKSLFLLNSFVDGKKKSNHAFALFLREGVATPGFNPLPTAIDVDRIAGWTYAQLRDALVKCDSGWGASQQEALVKWHATWGASQTAMWLKNATVGSFVIIRHEYGKCKFCPKRLKDKSGKYIGPVYVIGVITKKVVPWSAEERDIAENRMGEFSKHHWGIHNVCRVSWRMMGYKKSLKEESQKYINHVCQPTLQRICDDFKKVYAGGATSESIRQDLWANATIPICSDDFPDIFDHRGISERTNDLT